MFESFYDEFLETLILLRTIIIFISLSNHPTSKRYGENGLVGSYKKRNVKNVFIIPDNINTKTILNVSDKIVTSRGTIALEFAALGKNL